MNKEELKEIRKELKLTQGQLADKLGVIMRTVQKWEAGDSKVSKQTAILINQMRTEGDVKEAQKPTENELLLKIARLEGQLEELRETVLKSIESIGKRFFDAIDTKIEKRQLSEHEKSITSLFEVLDGVEDKVERIESLMVTEEKKKA